MPHNLALEIEQTTAVTVIAMTSPYSPTLTTIAHYDRNSFPFLLPDFSRIQTIND